MPDVRVVTRAGPRDFSGELIAHSETHRDPRWIEFQVYRLDGGAGIAVVRGGMSKVYHSLRTTCRTASGGQAGQPVTKAEMLRVLGEIAPDEEPVSCERCQPPWPEELGPEERIRYEVPRMTVDMHGTAQKAIQRLTSVRDRETGQMGTLVSAPVEQLLEMARQNDEEFAAADMPENTMRGPASSIGQLDS